MKKSICVDFDDVLHLYPTGKLIPGAIEFLTEAVKRFDVSVYSTRSGTEEGRINMMSILDRNGLPYGILSQIGFPSYKPPAYVFLDDRAICFNGTFPTMDDIDAFENWRADGKKT